MDDSYGLHDHLPAHRTDATPARLGENAADDIHAGHDMAERGIARFAPLASMKGAAPTVMKKLPMADPGGPPRAIEIVPSR